jgi:hypothetical protein
MVLASGPAACSAHDDRDAAPRADAATDGAALESTDAATGQTGDVATFAVSKTSAGDEDAPSAAGDAASDAPVVPPSMSCDADASDDAYASYCPPPLSMCADGTHLAYYDWGTCVSGQCVWAQKVMACPLLGNCIDGACVSNLTAGM